MLEQQVARKARCWRRLTGRALDVPVAAGAVIAPSAKQSRPSAAAAFFLRLAVPERYAGTFHEGDTIQIEDQDASEGTIARIYPQIENGRVIADVEVEGLDDAFVDARVLVRLPSASARPCLSPPMRSKRIPASISSP